MVPVVCCLRSSCNWQSITSSVTRLLTRQLPCFSSLWIKAWPFVLTVNLVAASTPRNRIFTTGAYIAIVLLLGTIILLNSPKATWGQIVYMWGSDNLLPTILLLAFLNRQIRAVGPLVFAVMAVALTGVTVALPFSGCGYLPHGSARC